MPQTSLVIDTNTWLAIERDSLDVFGILDRAGYLPVLLEPIAAELGRLGAGRTKHAAAARVALGLIKQKGLKTVSCSEASADDAILAHCIATSAAAATFDAVLKKRLREARVRVVTISERLARD